LREYKILKNEMTKSTFQSCTGLVKEIYHWILLLKNCIWSATEASQQAILNNSEKDAFRGWSPHKPKLDLRPVTHLILDKSRKIPHPLLMFFHNPTLKGPTTSLEHHPPLMLPYLVSIADLHKASLSVAKHHSNFSTRAAITYQNFLFLRELN
jgi:hypothetical protein